jgi:hypothetical protein
MPLKSGSLGSTETQHSRLKPKTAHADYSNRLTYYPDRDKWVARYQWKGKSVHIGQYKLKLDARAAYRAAIESIPYVL